MPKIPIEKVLQILLKDIMLRLDEVGDKRNEFASILTQVYSSPMAAYIGCLDAMYTLRTIFKEEGIDLKSIDKLMHSNLVYDFLNGNSKEVGN